MSVPFHRTAHGLSNQATFEGVDAIVFAEGGRFLTIEELEAGGGDSSTLDSAFWQTIIRITVPAKTVRVRSVGNKTTLIAIGQLLMSGSVNRVIVALDRDFDDRRGTKCVHPNVFYTYGYSWENDVFTESNLVEVLSNLAIATNVLASVKAHMSNAAEELRRCFSAVVRLDHSLAEAGLDPLLREELQKTIRLNATNPPVVLRSAIALELSRVRTSQQGCRIGPKACAAVDVDLQGHTVARWWLGHIHYISRTSLGGLKMSNDLISRLAISAHGNSKIQTLRYYKAMVSAAVW